MDFVDFGSNQTFDKTLVSNDSSVTQTINEQLQQLDFKMFLSFWTCMHEFVLRDASRPFSLIWLFLGLWKLLFFTSCPDGNQKRMDSKATIPSLTNDKKGMTTCFYSIQWNYEERDNCMEKFSTCSNHYFLEPHESPFLFQFFFLLIFVSIMRKVMLLLHLFITIILYGLTFYVYHLKKKKI